MKYQLPGSLIQLETHDIETLVAFNLMAFTNVKNMREFVMS